VGASEDAERDGPQALYAGDNGELLLLDQVNGRILRFDPKTAGGHGALIRVAARPAAERHDRPRGAIVVWDGAAHTLQSTGQTMLRCVVGGGVDPRGG